MAGRGAPGRGIWTNATWSALQRVPVLRHGVQVAGPRAVVRRQDRRAAGRLALATSRLAGGRVPAALWWSELHTGTQSVHVLPPPPRRPWRVRTVTRADSVPLSCAVMSLIRPPQGHCVPVLPPAMTFRAAVATFSLGEELQFDSRNGRPPSASSFLTVWITLFAQSTAAFTRAIVRAEAPPRVRRGHRHHAPHRAPVPWQGRGPPGRARTRRGAPRPSRCRRRSRLLLSETAEPGGGRGDLMDQCSRHAIPPAVRPPRRPAGARSSRRARRLGGSKCSLAGGSGTACPMHAVGTH